MASILVEQLLKQDLSDLGSVEVDWSEVLKGDTSGLPKKPEVASVAGPSFALHWKRLDATTDLSRLTLVWSLVSCRRHAVCWPFTGDSGLPDLAS